MTLFGKSVSKKLADKGFSVTKAIFEAPKFSAVPSIYQDETHRQWAVSLPGMEPAIHEYADILDCKVIENESIDVNKDMSRKDLFESVLMNPAAVSRANAGKDGKYCTSMNVMLTVKGIDGKGFVLGIPLVRREILRASRMYKLLREGADNVCEDILAMRDQADKNKSGGR